MAELTTLARPYAKAVFRLAKEKGQFDTWSDVLGLLSIIAETPEVEQLQQNPKISDTELVDFYVEVSGGKLEAEVLSFMKLLAQRGRLSLLPYIKTVYEAYKAEALSQVEVEVISAIPLNDNQKKIFQEKLQAMLNREITLHCKEDSQLLGGAIIRAGDRVIDGSVRGRLQQMAESLGA